MITYSPDPELDTYIRQRAEPYRRAMARHAGHPPRFLLGMAMQACVIRMFRRRMEQAAANN